MAEVKVVLAQFIGDVPVVEDNQALKTSRALMVGTVDGFEAGKFTIVDVRGREIGIYRAFDGRWHAVRNLCPHRGAPLCVGPVGGTAMPSEPGEFIFGMEEEVVRCPWHAMEFSLLTGESLFDVFRSTMSRFAMGRSGSTCGPSRAAAPTGGSQHHDADRRPENGRAELPARSNSSWKISSLSWSASRPQGRIVQCRLDRNIGVG
jgi:nitrite reductase (NADH) small subunit